MPTITAMELPRPTNWQDFESIVSDAYAQRWKTSLQKNGRPGQQQNGVDIYGPDDIGRRVGIQCKRYQSVLPLSEVEEEVAAAEMFKGTLTALYLATTAPRDAKLQAEVRVLSDKRVANGKFAVALIFWDDVVSSLLLNPEVFHAHYPQIQLDSPKHADRDRLLAALELGYHGADLWHSIELIFGELGWMAQVDPDQFIAMLEVRTRQLLAPEAAAPIVDCLRNVRAGCLSEKKAKSDWDPVEVDARRASSRINNASSLLPLEESNVLKLGLQLGRIYHHCDDIPNAQVRTAVEAKVKAVVPANRHGAVKSSFAAWKQLENGYDWATKAERFVEDEIRFAL
jgi:hypothetical protein